MKRDIPPPYEREYTSTTTASPSETRSQAGMTSETPNSDTDSNFDQRSSTPTEPLTSTSHSDNCDILPHLPAVWSVAHQPTRLSALAATVLIKAERLREKDLEALPPPYSRRPPSPSPPDPISGALIASHNVIGGVLHGVADYPIELSHTIRTGEGGFGKDFALTKGVARIVGTALKVPMDVTVNVARGFENLPGSLWGEEGRERERVVGVGSGLSVAGKGFGLGLYDGITGLVTQPYNSATEGSKSGGVLGGILGGITGFGKGIGGAVCKPVAGAVGVPAYALKGVYEGIRGTHLRRTFMAEGKNGWEEMGLEDQREIVRRWDDLTSHSAQ